MHLKNIIKIIAFMKKIILLLVLALVITLSGCNKPLTCTITSPQDGAEVSIYEDLTVTVEAKSSKGNSIVVVVFLDNSPYPASLTEPYTATINSILLELGTHTLRAVATDSRGEQAEATITINITEGGGGGGGGDGDESPDFVDFANGRIPTSWITNTWVIENTLGYNDTYSLKSTALDVSSVLTYKTKESPGYVEFYTRGDYFDLYIDGEKAKEFSSAPAPLANWKQWIYVFNAGRHSFRWETTGQVVFLDAIKFASAELPKVTTNDVTNIAAISATSGGNITGNGNSSITARGVCWSTTENPTINDNKTVNGSGTGSFTSEITGLEHNTTYYVRAYATNSVGTAYGEEKSFTTEMDDPEWILINGVKWARRNVNMPGTFTANPEDAGMFYQWNRQTGWSSTNPMINSNGGTNWDSSNVAGTTWIKAKDPCPAGWRVPTLIELESLADFDSYWGNLNGVSGRFWGSGVQTLFLPAAGYRYYTNGAFYYGGTYGTYWSSSSTDSPSAYAYYLIFSNASPTGDYDYRANGLSVRCVAE